MAFDCVSEIKLRNAQFKCGIRPPKYNNYKALGCIWSYPQENFTPSITIHKFKSHKEYEEYMNKNLSNAQK